MVADISTTSLYRRDIYVNNKNNDGFWSVHLFFNDDPSFDYMSSVLSFLLSGKVFAVFSAYIKCLTNSVICSVQI